jgi:hypothetical protein
VSLVHARAVPKRKRTKRFSLVGYMQKTYDELKELAMMCAYNARTTTSTPVAIELWNMAKEYQRKAAQLGELPDIGDTPPVGR